MNMNMTTRKIATGISAGLIGVLASAGIADTTQTGPSVYEIDEGVAFTMGNFASSDYLLNWSDGSGTFSDIVDPTLVLTAGETYTFENLTGVHPFVITDDTLEVDGSDGSFSRLTTDSAVINAATLGPIADFTSDPGGGDLITWTPSNEDAGDYYYTCRITGHLGMTGKIVIVEGAAACPADFTGDGQLNFFDVSAFLSAFGSMDASADFTGDGQFNFFDVSAFLSAFGAGCP